MSLEGEAARRSIRAAIMDLAVDDYSGLWELRWRAATLFPEHADEAERLAREETEDLVEQGLLAVYELDGDAGDTRLVPCRPRSTSCETRTHGPTPAGRASFASQRRRRAKPRIRRVIRQARPPDCSLSSGLVATTRTIDLRTDIPGPRSKEILDRIDRAIATPLSITLPVVAAEGRGAVLVDVDGNSFIDFTGGVGCLNVGHAHPRVVQAAQDQLERFAHTDFTVVPYEVYVRLAERLIELSPFRGPAKAAFFNAGTEAIENAVKFARSYTKRPAVIAFEGAFHGRTLLSMTLTSKTHPYKAGLGPFAPEVYRVPFAQDYRGPSAAEALAALERAFLTQVPAEQVAALVIEPVQGEGGFVVAPPEFLEGVRRICDEHGIVLVVDEVQTGFARTGKLFAIEHYGIEPDLMTVAKSIAGGLPLSGVIGKAQIMDAPPDSAIGGTFVGNPVAQAAALAVLDVIEDEGLVERANEIGDAIRTRMLAWQELHDAIGDVRGLGAMLALELVHDRVTKQPAPELASAVMTAAADRGLLLLKSGIYSNCIRVLVPLVIADAELDEALGVWEQALAAALA
jgi:4-aminobutyrate aminotransferase/(S)-3-amino-2-methylpropionate transaminase